jgi:hypothetical protein
MLSSGAQGNFGEPLLLKQQCSAPLLSAKDRCEAGASFNHLLNRFLTKNVDLDQMNTVES